ncbi:MAG: aspartate-semialdehyde dehydrogenase [Oligoflexia bacterium]|nr:aspartate-semialdehyde dehydrogenase [Oligoflexia bacterium]
MKTAVALLGATGPVGQKIVAMLEGHADFYLAEIASSSKNIGKKYGEVVHWREVRPLSVEVQELRMKSAEDISSSYVLSALPSEVAKELEPKLAARGLHVFSNASAMRMDERVPLLIPEINRPALAITKSQTTPGKIITNPNCTTVFFVSAIAPLIEQGVGAGVEYISLTTMQAISGAGYPGVSALDIFGNVVPHIEQEEKKICAESNKILSTSGLAHTKNIQLKISANVNRVPVINGHTLVIHLYFNRPASVEEVRAAYDEWQRRYPQLFAFYQEPDRPRPLYDLTPYDQKIHIGKIRQGASDRIITLVAMGHNLVRGAAGAAILNLEAGYRHLC